VDKRRLVRSGSATLPHRGTEPEAGSLQAAPDPEEALVADGTGVRVEQDGPVTVVKIDRPERRNAVDGPAAAALAGAFREFDRDPDASVAVLTGAGRAFCAGADLKDFMGGAAARPPWGPHDGDGPMGPTRLRLSKPVLAAIEGPAVAGGLELALWCDLRVAAEGAILGVFNRRFGVPLIDLGTIRLPRLIGHSRAMDLLLTGRPVGAAEALAMGLVNRVVPDGAALTAAVALAHELAALPQAGLRNDRLSAIEQWDLAEPEAVANELRRGMATLASGETAAGAASFTEGRGRHGAALPPNPGSETR
jgi:enoyl-CoA hydratase